MKNLDDDCTSYPVCFDAANILAVGEIGFDGVLDMLSGPDRISGSNYGFHRVQVAAIARNFTTDVRNGIGVYRLAGGTSNAAPVVTGIAALMLSVRPELRAAELKRILIESSRKLPKLAGKITSGGIVDASQAVTMAMRSH